MCPVHKTIKEKRKEKQWCVQQKSQLLAAEMRDGKSCPFGTHVF